MIYANPKRLHIKEGETFVIKGLGDIHHLLKESSEDQLIQDLTIRTTKKTLFIDIGDNLDSIGGANHKYFSPMRVKDRFFGQTDKAGNPLPLLNAEMNDLCDLFNKYTKPDEWIGHLSGNHPLMQLGNGIDMCASMCEKLNHPYLGYQAYVPIDVIMSGNHHFTIMIFAMHGFGGGRSEGASWTAYSQHASLYQDWDIAMYGHRHQKGVIPLIKMKPYVNLKTGRRWVREEPALLCQTGTYLRTLSQTVYPSYSEKGGMRPRPLGCINIPIKIQRVKDDDGLMTFKMIYEGM